MNEIEMRFDEILDEQFSKKIDELLAAEEANFAAGGASGQTGGAIKEYQTVSPEAKKKLGGILKHYAKEARPFTACVRDNRKRFGPRAESVCAVLKDIIRDTTKWRGNPSKDHGTPGVTGYANSNVMPMSEMLLDEEVVELIERLDELDLWTLLDLAQMDSAGVTQDHIDLLHKLHPHVAPQSGRGPSVSLKKDHKGFYVHTHRARSKSYVTVGGIPRHAVNFIKSTG